MSNDCFSAGCASSEGVQQRKPDIDSKKSPSKFLGSKIDVTEIPQYIRNYTRGDDLELWEIRPPNLPNNGN